MTHPRGFTLIEVLVAMAITVSALTLITYYVVDITNFGTGLDQRLQTSRELASTLRTMATEVRSMNAGANGSYPIATATATTFTFYSDIDGNGTMQQVRYFLDGTTLKKGVIEPTATQPATYPASSEQVSEVVHNMVPGTVFSYFPAGYPPQMTPLPSPINVAAVRLVEVTGTTDIDPKTPPGPSTLSIMITIRNLRGEI